MKNLDKKHKPLFLFLGMLTSIVVCLALLAVILFILKPWRQFEHSIEKKKSEELQDGMLILTVDPAKSIRPISPFIYGSNLTPKTEFEMDVAKFAKDLGVTIFRFPGSSSDGYRWKLGKMDFNDRFDNAPLSKMENVIKFCQISGSKLVLQVNIESGTPEEAAAWVKFMNYEQGMRVDYWELGNEVYGDWERNYMSAQKYAGIIRDYSIAMKKADPRVKIGANFGGPNYPDFDEALIKQAADYIDFVSYHWYPNHINGSHIYDGRVHPLPEEIMGNSLGVGNMVERIDKLLQRYAPHRKDKIEIAFLEWDGSWDAVASDLNVTAKGMMWSLANAIFYADTLGQFAVHGVSLANQYSFQEVMFGFIRGWDQEAGWGGSRWDGEIIRPKALAFQLFARHFGDILIESNLRGSPYYFKKRDWRADAFIGKVPYVTAYTSKFSNEKKIVIALINKHPDNDYKIKILLKNTLPQAGGCVWVLNGPNLEAQNDGHPKVVAIKKFEVQGISPGFVYKIAAHSVHLFEINLNQAI